MIEVIVLISGSGSNLGSIIDNRKDLGININLVISNKADVLGLERAKNSGIMTKTIISKDKSREEFEDELSLVIDKINPQIIILAGFMRVLTSDFVKKYKGRMLNIHPSLLPKFKGLDTHKRAIAAGEKIHGATVHLVSPELDSGEIIMQTEVDVLEDDTPDILAKRVLKQEHILYPQAIKKFIKEHL